MAESSGEQEPQLIHLQVFLVLDTDPQLSSTWPSCCRASAHRAKIPNISAVNEEAFVVSEECECEGLCCKETGSFPVSSQLEFHHQLMSLEQLPCLWNYLFKKWLYFKKNTWSLLGMRGDAGLSPPVEGLSLYFT